MSTEKNRALTERVFEELARGELEAPQKLLKDKLKEGGDRASQQPRQQSRPR